MPTFFFLLAALVVALAAVLFALQNVAPVTVSFLAWTFSGSLAIVVVLAALVGMLVGLLALLPLLVRGRVQRSHLRKQLAELEARAPVPTPGAAGVRPGTVTNRLPGGPSRPGP